MNFNENKMEEPDDGGTTEGDEPGDGDVVAI